MPVRIAAAGGNLVAGFCRRAWPVAPGLIALAFAVSAHADDIQRKDRPKNVDTLAAVTVTAEKTNRSLQDTATSVAVFDADQLEQQPGLQGSRDVFANIANVTATGTGNIAPTVRGVDGTGGAQSVDAFFAGSRQRLGVQIDGRPASFNEVVYGGASMWDVEQVEMLRGPQSTLQGRNAIAGTMAIKTNDPTWQPEYGARVIGGNHDNRQGAFYASGPLGDSRQWAYRIATDYETRDSYAHGFTPFLDMRDPGKFETKTLRGKLLFEPTALDDFSTLLTVNHAESRGPQLENILLPYSEHHISLGQQPVFEPKSTSVTADTKWGLNERVSVENLLSGTDLDVHRYAPPGQGIAQIDTREWMWEPHLRLNKTGTSSWSGLFGAYVYRANQSETLDIPGNESFTDRTRTAALFGEGVIDLSDVLDLTVGARYERETHRRNGGDGRAVAIAIDETYTAFLPKLGLAWHANENTTYGVDVGRGYNGGGGGVTFGAPIVSYSYGAEYVWNYEAYFRSELAGGRLRLSGNLFYSDYKDMQLPFNLSQDPDVWSVVVRNAPKAKTYGAEFDARWLVVPGLEVHADLGLLDTDVTRDPFSGVQGHQLANAPRVTSDLGVTYRNPQGLELSMSARYSDAYYSTIRNLPQERVNSYWTVNAQAGYRFNQRWRVFAYVTNLFDSTIPLSVGATGAANVATLVTPRTYGVGVQFGI
jgi:outer membrane receptor protein involved in Fe transport